MAHTTSKTIASVFSDRTTAERARQDLLDSGFDRSEVQITSGDSLTSDAALGNTGLSGSVPSDRSSGGGIGGFFRNLFGSDIDERESSAYSNAMRQGGTVVTVTANEDRVDRALDILERYDPLDLDGSSSDTTQYRASGSEDRAIPIVEEELQVGKRSVQRGGIRVYSRIVEQPVEEEVTLREERVHVDRRTVDRPATEADFRPPDQVIEVTEMAEEAVIGKRARVKEEVVIGKETKTRKETVRDTVRKTDVSVEQVGEVGYDADFESDYRTRYAQNAGASYETYAPAYQYGYQMAGDPRYKGQSWDDVQDTIRTDYLRNNPNSTWDQMKGAVRFGWEKMTGKR